MLGGLRWRRGLGGEVWGVGRGLGGGLGGRSRSLSGGGVVVLRTLTVCSSRLGGAGVILNVACGRGVAFGCLDFWSGLGFFRDGRVGDDVVAILSVSLDSVNVSVGALSALSGRFWLDRLLRSVPEVVTGHRDYFDASPFSNRRLSPV